MCPDEGINEALRVHQLVRIGTWPHQPRLKRLHRFFNIFNQRLFPESPLPVAAISVDAGRRRKVGHYVVGRNGLGLRHNINLNARQIEELTLLEQLIVLAQNVFKKYQDPDERPPKGAAGGLSARVLVAWAAPLAASCQWHPTFQTRSYEMVHQWQCIHGSPARDSSYHNKEFRREAERVGLIVAGRHGHVVGIRDPFLAVCREHGVTDPVPPLPGKLLGTAGAGAGSLKKWVCGCVPPIPVRVSRPDVRIRCEDCGLRFVRAG